MFTLMQLFCSGANYYKGLYRLVVYQWNQKKAFLIHAHKQNPQVVHILLVLASPPLGKGNTHQKQLS